MQELLAYIKEEIKAHPKEVPIAAFILDPDGKIVSKAFNRRMQDSSIIAHAEILAMEKLSKENQDWNLSGYTLVVNLEPCPMCAGAINQAHIKEVIFGAYESKTGAFGSRYLINNAGVKITGGVLEEECSELLTSFFKAKR